MEVRLAGITFRTQADTSLVCPHRDLSVCPDCVATAGDLLVEVFGVHYEATPELVAALNEERTLHVGDHVYAVWPDGTERNDEWATEGGIIADIVTDPAHTPYVVDCGIARGYFAADQLIKA